jgi:hypothetical protein
MIKGVLLLLLGGLVVGLHLMEYAKPELMVGSRLVNWVAIPLLLGAALLLQRTTKFPADVRTDSTIKWGSLVFVIVTMVDVLLYGALMFNVLARFDSKYLASDFNSTFQAVQSRLGQSILLGIAGILLWPCIVTGVRDEARRANLVRPSSE